MRFRLESFPGDLVMDWASLCPGDPYWERPEDKENFRNKARAETDLADEPCGVGVP
jgi:hypothetical protein